MSNIFYGLSLIILVAIVVIAEYAVNAAGKVKKIKEQIHKSWGSIPEKELSKNDLLSISGYFSNLHDADKDNFHIDDITWNDLDMDKIFARVNQTRSTIGEEYLYALLRQPLFDGNQLKERERLICFFQKNTVQREKLQFILSRLGKNRYSNLSDYFLHDSASTWEKLILYRVLALIAMLSPALLLVSIQYGLMAVIFSFIINTGVYYKAKSELGIHLESLSYMMSAISAAKKISRMEVSEISDYRSILAKSCNNLKSINRKGFYLFTVSDDVFISYAKIIFLRELIDYEYISNIVYRYREDLKAVYETLGMLDSMIAAASYRESLGTYTVPVLKPFCGKTSVQLSTENIYHPLIRNPVPNSIEAPRSILVTGSNASGKSTFLKTMAVNALFAQTIHTCLARKYQSAYFMVFTSMALKDSLVNNESYYIAEIKSLKRIIDSLNNQYPCLCFIDEVLRGTNTVERIAASSQALHYLSCRNCLCFAATHDIELTGILEEHFDNYHFQEQFTEKDIHFDYKIYPGKSNSRNAIKLLRHIGYDPSIVTVAEERASQFIEKGSWDKIL